MTHRAGRSGYALPAAVGGLVIIGVLVTAGFYMARQEVRIGVASKNSSLAFYLAERGTNDVIAGWKASAMNGLSSWSDTTIVDSLDEGTVSVTVTRLANRLFFVDATSSITQGGPMLSGATRRTGMIIRLFSAALDPPAALTTRGPTSIKGSAEVHGEDSNPPAWGGYCSGGLQNKPGIVSDDTTQVSANTSNLTGDPYLAQDTTLNDSTFLQFGNTGWDELVAMADKDVTPLGTNINGTGPDSTASGGCVKATLTNWGNPTDPNAACGDYFPIIYHGGPRLRIQSGGVGQGILLVNGTLDLRGGFVFNGIIIVQGTFETQGSGNRVYGGVMASNASFNSQSLVGGSVVSYSSCAVERAVLSNDNLTRARPLAQRTFVDLSSVLN